MLSKDEGKAEQALALYAAAFCTEFCIDLNPVAAADTKFRFRLKCTPVKWRQLRRGHYFSGRGRLDSSLVHICDSTARLERVINVRHQLWLFFATFFFSWFASINDSYKFWVSLINCLSFSVNPPSVSTPKDIKK